MAKIDASACCGADRCRSIRPVTSRIERPTPATTSATTTGPNTVHAAITTSAPQIAASDTSRTGARRRRATSKRRTRRTDQCTGTEHRAQQTRPRRPQAERLVGEHDTDQVERTDEDVLSGEDQEQLLRAASLGEDAETIRQRADARGAGHDSGGLDVGVEPDERPRRNRAQGHQHRHHEEAPTGCRRSRSARSPSADRPGRSRFRNSPSPGSRESVRGARRPGRARRPFGMAARTTGPPPPPSPGR